MALIDEGGIATWDPLDAQPDAELDCLRCAHAQRHHWIGPPEQLAHCDQCHRDWPRRNEECHCTACHRHFKSERAFDLHQTANRCVDPCTRYDTRGRPVLVSRNSDHGPIWVRHDERQPPSATGSCQAAAHGAGTDSTLPTPPSSRPRAGAGTGPQPTPPEHQGPSPGERKPEPATPMSNQNPIPTSDHHKVTP